MNVQVHARPLVMALLLGLAPEAWAQTPPPADVPTSGANPVQPEAQAEVIDAPPHVVRLDGSGAQLVRDGAPGPLEIGDPIFFGDRLELGQAMGQILLGDGSRVALDRGARLESLAADLLALTAGRAVVTRPAPVTVALRVDTPAASLLLAPGGEYRITLDGDMTTLAVVRGRADVQTGLGDQPVEAGHQIAVRDGLAPETARRYNAAGYDSFVEWANRPPAAPAAGTPLETFQDPQFEAYADVFNSHGSWENDPRVGAVWYPQVGADWRPYTDGYWQAYGSQDQWLWVGRDPWGWPTHHYGRWGVNPRGRWYWMPGKQWAPSYVSWSVGPGYIGWTPLGYQDRPQWGWDSLSRPGVYPGGTLDPSRAWTVVPSGQFGQRGRLGAYAVDPRTLDNLSAFVSQRVGPPIRYGGASGPGYGYGSRPYGGPGGTTMYGPGGYRGGVSTRPGAVGPTRVGPPTPGYGGPTPPPDDPYERAQRAVAPRSRQRAPAGTEQPAAAPPPGAESGATRQRNPPRETPSTPPPARESAPPAAEAPPASESAPPAASSGRATGSTTTRATGSTTGRRAVPRP